MHINEESKIDQNYNFCKIEETELIKTNKIILNEGNTYIFEIKNKLELFLGKIQHIDEVQERFIEAFKYVEIDGWKIYNIQNYKKIFIFDHNKNDAQICISKNKEMKNKNILYMNPQVGVTAMLRLNKNLKYLNKEITDLKKAKNKSDKEITSLKKAKIKSDEEIIDLKKQIIEFKAFSFSQFEILNNKIEAQKKDQQKKKKN